MASERELSPAERQAMEAAYDAEVRRCAGDYPPHREGIRIASAIWRAALAYAEQQREADGMPVFVLKAKDDLAEVAIDAYAERCREVGLESQACEVETALIEFMAWRRDHPELCHLPDHKHVAVEQRHVEQHGTLIDALATARQESSP